MASNSKDEEQSTIINLTIENDFIDVLNSMEKKSLNKSSMLHSDMSVNMTKEREHLYSPMSVAQ